MFLCRFTNSSERRLLLKRRVRDRQYAHIAAAAFIFYEDRFLCACSIAGRRRLPSDPGPLRSFRSAFVSQTPVASFEALGLPGIPGNPQTSPPQASWASVAACWRSAKSAGSRPSGTPELPVRRLRPSDTSVVVLLRWCCCGGAAAVVLPQWCCRVVLSWWCCCGGAAV